MNRSFTNFKVEGSNVIGQTPMILPEICISCGADFSKDSNNLPKNEKNIILHCPSAQNSNLDNAANHQIRVVYSICKACQFQQNRTAIYFGALALALTGLAIFLPTQFNMDWRILAYPAFAITGTLITLALNKSVGITAEKMDDTFFKISGFSNIFLVKANTHNTESKSTLT